MNISAPLWLPAIAPSTELAIAIASVLILVALAVPLLGRRVERDRPSRPTPIPVENEVGENSRPIDLDAI